MFNLFRKLMGKEEVAVEKPKEAQPATAKPPAVAAVPATDAPGVRSFVCREPVVSRDERIAGYEFILPERVQARLQGGGDSDSLRKAYDDALLHNLCAQGADALLGSRLAFVRLSPASLENPLIAQLPATNTVLIFSPSRLLPESVGLQQRLNALRQQGFACGWLLRQEQLLTTPELLSLAACADYVQVETGGFDGTAIKTLFQSLHAARPAGMATLRMMASGLGSFDEFHLCFQGGFDFFLGQFVNSRENWHPPKSNINRLHVIDLLNTLRSGAEFDVIAQQLKLDPVLTFKLLRYLNSPMMGLQTPVTTMDKALMVLGRERFSRWLSLFLFDIKSPGYRDRVLTERALARAHFLESLAGQGAVPAHKDQLFMLGLFSQLDLLMGQSMSEMLQQARLPESVHQALLGEAGVWADALALAVAAEGSSPEDLETKAGVCGLDALQVSSSAIEALQWAHEVSSLDEG